MRVLTSLAAATVATSGAVAMAHHGEIVVARTGANVLVGHIDFEQPVLLLRSVYPGFPGFATADTGFSNTPIDEPAEDLFRLDGASDIAVVLMGVDAGARIHNGLVPLQVGQSLQLGQPFFDFHAVWTIPGTAAHGDVYTFRFKLHDNAGISADSDEFTVSYTPACDGDYDLSGAVTIEDIFIYLRGWFTARPDADFDRDGHVSIDDLFEFLAAWFTPCV